MDDLVPYNGIPDNSKISEIIFLPPQLELLRDGRDMFCEIQIKGMTPNNFVYFSPVFAFQFNYSNFLVLSIQKIPFSMYTNNSINSGIFFLATESHHAACYDFVV